MIRVFATIALLGLSGAALAQEAAPPAGSAPPASDRTAVDNEFAAYDTDRSGALDQKEFAAWFASKAQQKMAESGQNATPEEVNTQAMSAFAQADTDSDRSISREELSRFLAA